MIKIILIGVEIFRVLSEERTFLELRDLMNYLKENGSLDLDFVN